MGHTRVCRRIEPRDTSTRERVFTSYTPLDLGTPASPLLSDFPLGPFMFVDASAGVAHRDGVIASDFRGTKTGGPWIDMAQRLSLLHLENSAPVFLALPIPTSISIDTSALLPWTQPTVSFVELMIR